MFIIFGISHILIIIFLIIFLVKKEKKPIVLFSKIVIFSTLISIIKYIIIDYIYNPGYPNSTFLYNPLDRYNDFKNLIEICKDLDPYNMKKQFVSNYFPFANIFYFIIYELSNKNMLASIIVYSVLFLLIFLLFFNKMVKQESKDKLLFSISILVSYPVIFSLDRMNLEMYLFLFSGLFIYFYRKEKNDLAILFLSFAICMKLYPLLFLLLFLKDKNYKAIIKATLICLILTVFSLALFKEGIVENIKNLLIGLNWFNNVFSGLAGIQHNLSLYGVLKLLFLFINSSIFKIEYVDSNYLINNFLKIKYLIFVIIYFILISSYLIFIEKTFWKKVFLIVSMFILLPHVSFDYKLLFIILVIFLFFENLQNEKKNIFYTILFAILIIPNGYFYIINDVSIGVIINPFIIMVITIGILFDSKNLIASKFLKFNNRILLLLKNR